MRIYVNRTKSRQGLAAIQKGEEGGRTRASLFSHVSYIAQTCHIPYAAGMRSALACGFSAKTLTGAKTIPPAIQPIFSSLWGKSKLNLNLSGLKSFKRCTIKLT